MYTCKILDITGTIIYETLFDYTDLDSTKEEWEKQTTRKQYQEKNTFCNEIKNELGGNSYVLI